MALCMYTVGYIGVWPFLGKSRSFESARESQLFFFLLRKKKLALKQFFESALKLLCE